MGSLPGPEPSATPFVGKAVAAADIRPSVDNYGNLRQQSQQQEWEQQNGYQGVADRHGHATSSPYNNNFR
jgi:hypothetical protein